MVLLPIINFIFLQQVDEICYNTTIGITVFHCGFSAPQIQMDPENYSKSATCGCSLNVFTLVRFLPVFFLKNLMQLPAS